MTTAVILASCFTTFLAAWFIKLCIQQWPRVDGKLVFTKVDIAVIAYNVLAIGAFIWMWFTD